MEILLKSPILDSKYYFSNKKSSGSQTRGQLSLSQSQSALQNSNIQFRLQRKLSPVELLPLNSEILELYNEYEENYTLLNRADKMSIYASHQLVNEVRSAKSVDHDTDIKDQNRVIVQRFKFYYFRIKIKGKQSPIQLCFNFSERVVNLKIYLSTTAEFPTSFNADQFVQSKYALVVSKRGQKHFHENYLYISLHCETDTKLHLQTQFGKEAQLRPDFKKQKTFMCSTEQSPNDDRRIKLQTPQVDKIQKNMNVTQNCSAQKLKLLFNMQSERITKQKRTMLKKQQFSEEFQVSKILRYRARQIIPQYREYEKKFKQQVDYLLTIQFGWFYIISVLNLAGIIHHCLEQTKMWHHKRSLGLLLAWRFKLTMMMDLKQNGNTLKERCLNRANMSMYLYARLIRDQQIKKASAVLQNVLKQTVPVMTIKNRIFHIFELVLKVQNKFRWHKVQKKMFFDKFWKLMNQVYIRILSELQNRNNAEKQVPVRRSSILLIDRYPQILQSNVMIPIVDKYLLSSKKRWMEYIHFRRIKRFSICSLEFPSEIEKLKIVAYSIKEPKLYQEPSLNDQISIIEQYAIIKNLL